MCHAFKRCGTAEGVAAEAKTIRFCNKEYDMDTGIVEFQFGNGKTLTLDSNAVSEDTRKQLMLHGISQKVGDSFAGAKGDFASGIQSSITRVSKVDASRTEAMS